MPSTLSDFGVDVRDVLRVCGLPDTALDDPERALSPEKYGDFLEACVRATNCPHFALLVGQRVSWANFGPVGGLLRNAPVLGDALRDIVANHQRLARGSMVYLFPMKDEIIFGYLAYQSGVSKTSHLFYDLVVAGLCSIIRMLSGVSPVEVLIARDTPIDPSPYLRYYSAPVRFNADASGLILRKSDLQRPIFGANPIARRRFQEQVNKYWAVGAPSIIARIQRAIMPNILLGKLSVSNVARAQAMHARTLNRRLEAEGTTFRAEVERLRYEVAQQLLANTRISVTEISNALRYSNVSAFSRSFQRWSGISPSECRKRMQTRPSAFGPDSPAGSGSYPM